MRQPVDRSRILELLEVLGRQSRGGGSIFLTGGASALLEGWRGTTVDVDLKLDPEPAGIFQVIARLKNELDINIELSSPDQFIPTLPNWRSNSKFIARFGRVDVFHYDFRAQALAKVARFHDRDKRDVVAMIRRGLVTLEDLEQSLGAVEPDLIRFPSLELEVLRRRLKEVSDEA